MQDNTMLANRVVRSGRKTDGRSNGFLRRSSQSGRDRSAVKASSQAVIPRDRNSANP